MGRKYLSPDLQEIYQATIEVSRQILESNVKIDLIIGVSRGGLIPARLISDLLDIPEIEIVKASYYRGVNERKDSVKLSIPESIDVKDRVVLVVDDVADTGDTLIEIEKALLKLGASKVYKATLYVKPWNKAEIDFHYGKTDLWIIFPWEIVETLRKAKTDQDKRQMYDSLSLPEDIKRLLRDIAEREVSKCKGVGGSRSFV